MKKVLLLIVSFLISIVFLEFVLQVAGIQPKIYKVEADSEIVSSNPILGFEPNPNYELHNSLGLNNDEVKEQSSPRGLVLGDSITYGCCRDQYSYTFSSLMNDNNSIDAEIINAGVNGYNTSQEVEFYLQRLKKTNPDLIILQVSQNDWNTVSFDNQYLLENMPSKEDELTFWLLNTNQILKNFRNIHLVQYVLYFNALRESKSLISKDIFNPRLMLDLPQFSEEICFGGICDGEISESDSKTIRDGFLSLKKSLNGKQKVLVVVFPDFTDIVNYDENLKLQHDYVSKLAKENGFYFLDLLSCYQEAVASSNEPVNYDDDTGHKVASECILNFIDEQELL